MNYSVALLSLTQNNIQLKKQFSAPEAEGRTWLQLHHCSEYWNGQRLQNKNNCESSRKAWKFSDTTLPALREFQASYPKTAEDDLASSIDFLAPLEQSPQLQGF